MSPINKQLNKHTIIKHKHFFLIQKHATRNTSINSGMISIFDEYLITTELLITKSRFTR